MCIPLKLRTATPNVHFSATFKTDFTLLFNWATGLRVQICLFELWACAAFSHSMIETVSKNECSSSSPGKSGSQYHIPRDFKRVVSCSTLAAGYLASSSRFFFPSRPVRTVFTASTRRSKTTATLGCWGSYNHNWQGSTMTCLPFPLCNPRAKRYNVRSFAHHGVL